MKKPVTHNFGATYQEGIVCKIDDKSHRLKVTIPALEDFETAWLPYLSQNAGSNQFYCLPDEGELVAVLLDARGEGGCVLGTVYNDQDPTPASSRDIWKKTFTNGTTIEHNRKTGNLTIHTSGKVIINDSPVDVNNGDITVNNADVNVKNGDVIADGISLKKHLHDKVASGKSKTGKPV